MRRGQDEQSDYVHRFALGSCRFWPVSFDVLEGRTAREPTQTEFDTGAPPNPEAFVAMQTYNETAVKAGVLVAAEGLSPASKGARVEFSGDERIVTDGPFTESKELVAGFSIIKVKSLEEAIEWGKRAPNVSPSGKGLVEIRKLMDV